MNWNITEQDAEYIALGAGVLGTGGGGDPYLAKLQLIEMLRAGHKVEVITSEEVNDNQLGCGISGMGAPTIGIEKLPVGDEMWQTVKSLQNYLQKDFSFIVIGEIGGGNAIEGLIAAASANLPVVDADPMGRAFPELQMDTFMINDVSPSPFGLSDGIGNSAVLTVNDAETAERVGRALTIAMGGSSSLALPVITGRQLKDFGIHGTLSLCHTIGKAIIQAKKAKSDVFKSIAEVVPAKRLFTGKVVDVNRKTTGGFAKGEMILEGLNDFTGSELTVNIQNEFLMAYQDGRPVAMVPDLISVLDLESGDPIGTESLRYGLRLEVIGMPASPKLQTEKALPVVGPKAFGYDIEFEPMEI
ncbi:hypothetical protein JNUCC1_02635 [Lentibacillus sp. JNUCC-1]|uniref:DUF917 domain-containing protein n=1 Tax=Lentibacillus sp. JNUCC-1 TaxID=2654513 RepID=UPI0012E83D84|nr:DUF917 domain-containing protein [Lentibacillus sp. JNUCC-1]MUV38764.1 hypothetical protein [Lentibacillus sp. JNUCC-1]